jgi:putative transcriptional regulator
MDDTLFNELVEGILEMKAIEKGTLKPGRMTRMEPSEVTRTRQNMRLSQAQFARMMGISVRTLQNWEQGHRKPTGSAKILLRIARKHPKAVLESVSH